MPDALSQNMCYQDIEMQRIYENANTLEKQQIDQLKNQANQFARNFQDEFQRRENTSDLIIGTDYIIPVVVHIVENGGGASTITQLNVERTIEMLNRFFSGKSAYDPLIDQEFVNVRGAFNNKKIKFVLANYDPNGNPTSGVTFNNDATYGAAGQLEGMRRLYNWPRENYFNIYVVDAFSDGSYSGFATFPWMVDTDPEIDGHVMQFWAFGEHDSCYQTWYHNLSHEVGHWLNLSHIWSLSNQSCDFDDDVLDTPNTDGNSYQDFDDYPGPGAIYTCGTKDNLTNMMDYTAPFYAMFTDGQRLRMEAALNSPIAQRNELWQTDNVLATIYGCTTGPDSDGDNIPNACDICPNDAGNDSDNDGVCDSLDQCAGLPDVDLDAFPGIPDACDPDHPIINFNTSENSAYDASEDFGLADIYDNGATLYVTNNGWKAVDFAYKVLPTTVLEFDFKSTIEGEAHYIGFDTDNQLPATFQYMIHGRAETPNATTSTTYNTYPNTGEWVHYSIPIGTDFVGTINKIFFSADSDEELYTGINSLSYYNDGTSFFRNVKVYCGVGFSTTTDEICIDSGIQTGLGGGFPEGGTYSGDGVTDDGNGVTYTFDPAVAGAGTASITYELMESCSSSLVSVTTFRVVDESVPTLVCQNATVTLDGSGNASIINSDVLANLPVETAYIEETIPFSPIANTGTSVTLSDDNGTTALPIDFDFEFYGTTYSNFYIASNGWISFLGTGMTGEASRSGTVLPTTTEPNGMIAGVWDDLNPSAGGTIQYQTIGAAPNRKLLVDFVNVPIYNSASTVTFQIQLHEQTNRIEIHYTDVQNNGGTRTAGIENAAGDQGLGLVGKNLTTWTAANEAFAVYRPTMQDFPDICGNPITISFSQSEFTCKDIGDVVVTVTADNGNGGIATCDATVTVVGPTSTYDGSWDVSPTAERKAIINSNYITSVTGNIDACACEMNANLSIANDNYVKLEGNLTVNGGSQLYIANTGSFVQVDDEALVINNGTINVQKITPTLAEKSFMIMGSPMTSETREGVYENSYIVRHHDTDNFVPNPDVELVSGGINNWADDNGNNWLTHTSTLNPGEGYMVFPQPDGASSGSYTHFYTQGTLNNGVINFNLGYNGTQNGSPNMLANPYPSAIEAELFFNHPTNANINVVYFWEHNTPLSTTYPGYNDTNYSMADISLYSESLGGGVPAASGGTAPTQFIASGQGFGVKPTAGGIAQFNNSMRVTGPNDTYRRSISVERDRLWLKVYNDTYGLGSTALIGFTETTSDGFIDSEDVYRLPTPVSLYSELETGEELVVNARGSFEVEDAFYLSFTTQVKEPQNYRISIDNLDGVNLDAATVYLIDSLTGSITNLSEGDYTFQSGEAVYHKRFKVVFQPQVLGANDVDLDSVSVYPNPTQNILYIVSPRVLVHSATVYDIRGRQLQTIDFSSEANKQLDISSLSNALYFVEITTESGTVTKRIVKE
ncbi:hypothetical protein GCM10008083_32080 [Ulvibacter litoralis]|nr:hypothetical protein GCM10008083_32080 [Ulvibacter litoralis]